MRTYLDCLPCFVSQALDAARMVSDDPGVHETVLREVALEISRMDMEGTPPEMGALIHRTIRQVSGNDDPYAHLKKRFTKLTLDLLPGLASRVRSSPDPFDTAIRICIAGNVIDFGASLDITEADVLRSIEDSISTPVQGLDPTEVRPLLEAADSILYVGDNAGEIVLDRLLIEHLDPGKVTFVVRGSPVINDATMQDARASGLTDLVRVITTGADFPGAPPARCSDEFNAALHAADLVIAKGQGNYETLGEIDEPILLMLRAKCPVIARDIGVALGSFVIERRP